MALRRPHRKSRHGCKTCKRRRVKCDEARPSCSNCDQRQEPCDYGTESPYIWAVDEPPTRRGRRRAKPLEQTQPEASQATSRSFDILGRVGTSNEPAPSLQMSQLELIIQWNSETHRYFARSEETRPVWQLLVVEEALSTPFLMHGILAVSALHLSLSRAEPQSAFWLGLAMAHKGEALPPFLEALSDVNSSNAKAMLSFSSMVVAFAFGSALTSVSEADQPSLDALNNVFGLCRGVQEITNNASSFLRQSNFAPLLNPSTPPSVVPGYVEEAFDRLENLNTSCGIDGNHDTATYARVIAALRNLSAFTYSYPTSMTLAAGWAIRSPPAYLEYVQRKEPFSLVVHAHYCAFLHLARDNWFIQSWGSCVLRDIHHLLDSSWKEHIRWPIGEVFGPDAIM